FQSLCHATEGLRSPPRSSGIKSIIATARPGFILDADDGRFVLSHSPFSVSRDSRFLLAICSPGPDTSFVPSRRLQVPRHCRENFLSWLAALLRAHQWNC